MLRHVWQRLVRQLLQVRQPLQLRRLLMLLAGVLSGVALLAHGQEPAAIPDEKLYRISPGDVLSINVWNEETLTLPQVLVRPDGFISMPLLGNVQAGGLSVPALQQTLKQQLVAFLRDEPILTVSLLQFNGNSVFVLGKVNRPGAYSMSANLDVTQALALAGGLAAFADEDDILILRRDENGQQQASHFPYDQVKKGKQLARNQLLRSGDVIIVP